MASEHPSTTPWLDRLLIRDPWLTPYRDALIRRRQAVDTLRRTVLGDKEFP